MSRRATAADPDPGHEPFDRRDGRVLVVLLGLFAASRLAWILLNPLSATYWEEYYRLTAAHDLLHQPIYPLLDYQADHYQGGSLVVIVMSLPLLLVLGQSIVALKLVALAFALATLAGLYVLGRLFFGRTAGLVVSLAYLAGPPLVAFSGLVAMGSHGESTLFSILQLTIFFGLLGGRWRTPRAWALFGLVSGLGLWFCYTSGLSLAACALIWVLTERPPRPAEIGAAIAGGVVGLLPWFVYNAGHGFIGVSRIGEMFGYGSPIDNWASQSATDKLMLLLSRDLVTGVLFPFGVLLPRAVSAATIVAFFVPIGLAFLLAIVRVTGLATRLGGSSPVLHASGDARRREVLFFVYMGVFLAVFLLSNFTINPDIEAHAYRIFLPPAVLLLFPAAITAARAIESGGRARALALGGLAAALLASAVGSAAIAARTPTRDQELQSKSGYVLQGLLLHRKWERELDRALHAAHAISDYKRRSKVLMGIGWGLEYRYEQTGEIDSFFPQLRELDQPERTAILMGIRWSLNLRIRQILAVRERGDSTPEQDARLDRLRRFKYFLNDPYRWYRLTGRVPRSRKRASEDAP